MPTEYRIEDLPPEMIPNIKVNPVTGCWEYQKAVGIDGHANIYYQRRAWPVHRLAWQSLVGAIPDGLVLDHVQDRGCRSNACCWPEHLEPVTPAVNSSRAVRWMHIRRREAVAVEAARVGGRAVSLKEWRKDENVIFPENGEPVLISNFYRVDAVVVPPDWYERARVALGEVKGDEQ